MIKDRLKSLRNEMANAGVDAFIVYSADPHMSEYLPEEWLERAWLSGFTGSAGFVVITQEKAALWTDSRYFVQAPIELKGSGIELMKEGEAETPDYTDWIIGNLGENAKVAVNTLATSHKNWNKLKEKFQLHQIDLIHQPLLDKVWEDRGKGSTSHIFIHPEKWAGKSVSEKLQEIREKLKENNADSHVITALDDVAWTLNLRGSDVDYNPVFLGYIYLTLSEAILFVDENKLDEAVLHHLQKYHVEIKPYSEFYSFLESINNRNILVSGAANQNIFNSLNSKNTIIDKAAPGNLMKAVKNQTELEGFRKVMIRDGVAMTKFLYWLRHEGCQQGLTEYEIGLKLKDFRAEGENFVGESFGSIIGYQGNGAIVHYSAQENSSKVVKAEGSILIDSGGQYLEGTTDITRTLALGEVSHDFLENMTLVLQGMINLTLVKFPKGTKGVHLDAFARLPLWMHAKDYGHGTGHGVGSFMNVHEPPQNIRKDMNPQELIPGMVLSNEPGFYVENEYGIRHENLVVVTEAEKSDFGKFYTWETLTICPFFVDSILPEMLTAPQKEWLNNYHEWCREKLETHLEGDVKKWFLELVQPI